MNAGFSSPYLVTRSSDGRNFILTESVRYTTNEGVEFEMPRGASSDGASTPPEIWLTIPPFGSYWMAAFLHDCAYRGTLRILNLDGTYNWAMLTKDACDGLLLEAMTIVGTHEFTRRAIYEGVALGGNSSFENDRLDANVIKAQQEVLTFM